MIYDENLSELGLENDPEFQEDVHRFTPTFGVVFLYNRDKVYFGLSSPSLLSSTFNSNNSTNLKNVHYSYFGCRFEEVMINPSFY